MHFRGFGPGLPIIGLRADNATEVGLLPRRQGRAGSRPAGLTGRWGRMNARAECAVRFDVHPAMGRVAAVPWASFATEGGSRPTKTPRLDRAPPYVRYGRDLTG